MTNASPRHPAKYTPAVVECAADVLKHHNARNVLDPFAGTGERIAALREHGWDGDIAINELEREWAIQASDDVDFVRIGDAESMPFENNAFDAVFTSVVYGNRLSDHHDARDGSRRNTYTHALGRKLTTGNTGAMQFTGRRKSSMAYATKHRRVYVELRRVLVPGGLFVLNVSDHLRTDKRKGVRRTRRVRTVLWHVLALKSFGFEVIEWHRIETPRLRYGANGEKRVPHEMVVVFRKKEAGV